MFQQIFHYTLLVLGVLIGLVVLIVVGGLLFVGLLRLWFWLGHLFTRKD